MIVFSQCMPCDLPYVLTYCCRLLLLLFLQYETTANTLAFSLFCLATHPEAEAKVVEEIRAAAEAEAAAQEAAAAAGTQHQPWYTRSLEEQVCWLMGTPWCCKVV